jgi:hypothetical protein
MTLFSFTRRHLCSLSLLAALSLCAAGLSLGGYDAFAATLKPNFKSRDATRYPQNPNLAPYGLKNLIVAYEEDLWPLGADRTQPNTAYIANTYIPTIKGQNPDVIVIDIEQPTWIITTSSTSAQNTDRINKYKKVIAVFRRDLPNAKIGLYSAMPRRNWLAPCGDPAKRASRYASWHSLNLKLQPLADSVDIIFPSLYGFYSDSTSRACYASYAKAQVKEARIYGKPVWGFLWMKYSSNGSWVARSDWRTHLETAYAAADGLVIWSQKNGSPSWSWSAPWWLETKDFQGDKGLIP